MFWIVYVLMQLHMWFHSEVTLLPTLMFFKGKLAIFVKLKTKNVVGSQGLNINFSVQIKNITWHISRIR